MKLGPVEIIVLQLGTHKKRVTFASELHFDGSEINFMNGSKKMEMGMETGQKHQNQHQHHQHLFFFSYFNLDIYFFAAVP